MTYTVGSMDFSTVDVKAFFLDIMTRRYYILLISHVSRNKQTNKKKTYVRRFQNKYYSGKNFLIEHILFLN